MQEEAKELDLRELLSALRRRWWIVVFAIALGVTGAYLQTRRMPKVYQAQSQIEIKAPEPNGLSLISNLSGSSVDAKQTQLALLQNPSVADQIVLELASKNG